MDIQTWKHNVCNLKHQWKFDLNKSKKYCITFDAIGPWITAHPIAIMITCTYTYENIEVNGETLSK